MLVCRNRRHGKDGVNGKEGHIRAPEGEVDRIHHCYKAEETEYHNLHNRREQAAAYDDNAAGPDRGNRHNSAVEDILVVVEEPRSHLEGIVAAAGNHHHRTEVDLEGDSRTLRDVCSENRCRCLAG